MILWDVQTLHLRAFNDESGVLLIELYNCFCFNTYLKRRFTGSLQELDNLTLLVTSIFQPRAKETAGSYGAQTAKILVLLTNTVLTQWTVYWDQQKEPWANCPRQKGSHKLSHIVTDNAARNIAKCITCRSNRLRIIRTPTAYALFATRDLWVLLTPRRKRRFLLTRPCLMPMAIVQFGFRGVETWLRGYSLLTSPNVVNRTSFSNLNFVHFTFQKTLS